MTRDGFEHYDILVYKGDVVNDMKKKMPRYGTTRVRREFLWLPRRMIWNPDHEEDCVVIRWLEQATWLQQYYNKWHDLYWIE